MRRILTAAALAVLIASPALAEESRVVEFDLMMNGEVVGTREVTLRYLPPEEGLREHEVRITQTWTEIDTTVAGWELSIRNRATAHASDHRSSFTSSLSVNGERSEVQGRSIEDDRWSISEVRSGKVFTRELRRTEVDLSTMDLLDPIRSQRIVDRSDIKLLSAETGTVLTGVLEDLGESELILGDRTVAIQRWGIDTNEGRMVLAWDAEGLLVESSMVIRGQTIQTRLRPLPPPRAYGDFELSMEAPAIDEEEL